MKRNRLFMWAYICFIVIATILRLFTSYVLWQAIVVAVTVSGIFFALEQLFSVLYNKYLAYADTFTLWIAETEDTIQRNVTIDKGSPEKYHVGATKTGEVRTVPVSPRVLALLAALKKAQQEKYQAVLLPRAFIFCRTDDPYKPTYPTEPTRWQRQFTERHGLRKVSPHDLRHTAATLALEGGASLKQVQELLGHADPSTTMSFYAGVTEEAQRRTVEGIEKLLAK